MSAEAQLKALIRIVKEHDEHRRAYIKQLERHPDVYLFGLVRRYVEDHPCEHSPRCESLSRRMSAHPGIGEGT